MNERALVQFGLVTALGAALIPAAFAAGPRTVGDVLQAIEREDRGRNVRLEKKTTAISVPTEKWGGLGHDNHNLRAVKPPRSYNFYQSDTSDEAQLERLTDEQIEKMYVLTEQYRRSKNRGELWLRLAELYSEKSRLLEFKKQQEYDRQLKEFQEKRRSTKPHLDLHTADEFNHKAIKLYEWFLKDFPNDDKVDQALFFLGYNYVQLSQVKRGVSYYYQLTKRFPNSPYVSESYFALGEYYFENEKWDKANENYAQVLQRKSARLFDFALYKSAWCYYRMGKSSTGLKYLENVIRRGQSASAGAQVEGRKEVNRVRLAAEARHDVVPFYAETRDCGKAESYFNEITGNQKETDQMLEGLAYNYLSSGNRECARYLFRLLISKAPGAPKAFDYQYQIVQNYINVEHTKAFQEELFRWIMTYGAKSAWARQNSGNRELLQSSANLQETTLRNYVLQLHQTAQKSRTPGSMREASEGYKVYLQAFPTSKHVSEMHFFYGELLFDLKEWVEAGNQYLWVTQNDPKSPYYEKATTNSLIALDKTLPDEKVVREKLHNATEPQNIDPEVVHFQLAAQEYFKSFPNGQKVPDIKFRIGRFLYAYGHLDEAVDVFKGIIRDYPKSKFAEYSANLILDIYDLKKDYNGLTVAGNEILANPALANSTAGNEVRRVIERASFKRGQDLEVGRKYGESAREFEGFAKSNPKSPLVTSAQYNAGVNYERSGDVSSAMRMYALVIATPKVSDKGAESKNADLKQKSRKLSAGLLQQTGQFKEAAVQFERFANENSNSSEAPNFYYNAAVIFDGLDEMPQAVQNYEQYFKRSSAKDRKEAYFAVAEMFRRNGRRNQALSYYEKYLSSQPADAQKTVDATYRMGLLHEQSGAKEKAYSWFKRAVVVYKELSDKGQTLNPGSAAESKLRLSLKELDALRAIRIPNNPANQQAAVQQKLALINKLTAQMADVIRYDHGPTIVGALAVTGQAYDHMFIAVSQVPTPQGLSPDELKQYQAGIEQIVTPFRAKAIENYKAAYSRAMQLEAFGEWSEVARRGVERYQPGDVPGKGEKASESRALDWMGL